MGTRELAVAGLGWSVEPPPEPTENEIAQAAQCQAALKACKAFTGNLAHLVGEGALFGYGWSEVVWTVPIFGEFSGLEVPAYMKPISCRRFEYRTEDGRLVFVPVVGMGDGVDLLEKYGPGNFIAYAPRINGDVPVREGLARVIVWMATMRNWSVRDWLLCGELGWKPWRRAKYAKGADDEDREAAALAVQTLTAAGACVHPDTVEIDVEWPKASGVGNQGTHRELAEYLGQEISKAVLGQTLTTEAGSRGARSLGEVHDNIRRDIRESDCVGIAEAINECLVVPFYAFNFGLARPGRFVFHTEDGTDMATLAEVVAKIAPFVDIPQSWVRDEIGCPEPAEGEPICAARAVAPVDEGESDDDVDDAA